MQISCLWELVYVVRNVKWLKIVDNSINCVEGQIIKFQTLFNFLYYNHMVKHSLVFLEHLETAEIFQSDGLRK